MITTIRRRIDKNSLGHRSAVLKSYQWWKLESNIKDIKGDDDVAKRVINNKDKVDEKFKDKIIN